MATRRTRIKGIANIPQRRKPSNKSEENGEEVKPGVVKEETKQPPQPSEILCAAPVNNLSNRIAPIENSNAPPPSCVLPSRRAFIKPSINSKLLLQKGREKPCAEKADIAAVSHETSTEVYKVQTESNLEASFQKENQSEAISEQEYPAPPPSPTKTLNRARIKVAPRLNQRRASTTVYGSASESEDEARKNKRIRTESVSSTATILNESLIKTDPMPSQKKEFSSIIQRKCKRTEQSRKMAEARRHFLHKFGNRTPDKQKLTMIDLIFYNPITNPMSQKQKRELKVPDDAQKKPDIDDTIPEEENTNVSEEENSLPAPQIKIGANGEIVIDEKSLIIENAETKKGREELQKSKLIDGDFNTNYGFYKREKRSKDWSKDETLRFYKALNTLGTDFTLMVELFSGRTRRELKMKFKKEERVNRALVDKALTQPIQFDITELREEARKYQRRLEQLEKAKEDAKNANNKEIELSYTSKRTRKRIPKQHNRNPKRLKPDLYSKLQRGIRSVYNSDSESDSSSVDEVTSTMLKPTRSGRIPKQKKFDDSDLTVERNKTTKTQNANDESELQPGTIMIVSSETPAGVPSVKMFMVTPDRSKVPIDLSEEVLNNLAQLSASPSSRDEHNCTMPSEEHNITIPAAEESNTITIPVLEENNIIFPATEECNITIPASEEYTEIVQI